MSFAGLTNQTISIKNPTGTTGKHGEKSLGSATSVSARVQRTSKTIVTPDREREPIHLICYVKGSTDVENGAQVTYDSELFKVLALSEAVDGTGSVHNIKLECQLWSWT